MAPKPFQQPFLTGIGRWWLRQIASA